MSRVRAGVGAGPSTVSTRPTDSDDSDSNQKTRMAVLRLLARLRAGAGVMLLVCVMSHAKLIFCTGCGIVLRARCTEHVRVAADV